jgi:hypothetical protein
MTSGCPDIEPLFVCQACGQRGADVRPDFHWEEGRDALASQAMKCVAREDSGWVCEDHQDRPWDGPHACLSSSQVVAINITAGVDIAGIARRSAGFHS